MVNYECPRCLYKVDNLTKLRKHLNRKIPCNVTLDGANIDLSLCLDSLSMDNDNTIFSVRINNIKLEMKNMELENRIREMEREIKDIRSSGITNVSDFSGDANYIDSTHNDNRITNININILNSFDNPNTEYILAKHADAALKSGNLIEGCIQMARLIWFNGNHPENHSIFKSNCKNNKIRCLENGAINQYTLGSKFNEIMEVILEVFERRENESERYYDLNDIFDNPIMYPNFYKELEDQLSDELYNHKELVKQTIQKFRERSFPAGSNTREHSKVLD